MSTVLYNPTRSQSAEIKATGPSGPSLQELGAWARILGLDESNYTVHRAYRELGWMQRCIATRSSAVMTMPWEIRRGETVLWSHKDRLPPMALNYAKNLPLLLFLSDASLVLCAQLTILKHRERGMRGVDALKYFSPAFTQPEYSNDQTTLVGFTRSDRINTTVPLEDLIYGFSLDPFVEIGPGASPGQAVLKNAKVLDSMHTFLGNFFDSGMIRATLIKVPQNTAPEEKSRLEVWWNRMFSGKTQSQKVVNEAVSTEQIGDGLAGLENKDLTDTEREAITVGLGLKPSMMMSNAANFATAKNDRIAFYNDTAIPAAQYIAGLFNEHLFDAQGVELRFFPERLEAFQESELQKAEALQKLTGRPILTVREARSFLERDDEGIEIEDGDVLANPFRIGGAGAPMQDAMTPEKRLDIKRWRRRINAKGREVTFVPDALSDAETKAIRLRLILGDSLEEVFTPPFV